MKVTANLHVSGHNELKMAAHVCGRSEYRSILCILCLILIFLCYNTFYLLLLILLQLILESKVLLFTRVDFCKFTSTSTQVVLKRLTFTSTQVQNTSGSITASDEDHIVVSTGVQDKLQKGIISIIISIVNNWYT